MTFEAYKVAIRLSLINNVSSGLVAISQQLMKTNKDVDTLHARLQKLQKLTLVGAAASGAGIFGLGVIGKALRPAEEYTHQLNIMNMAGMKQAEIAGAIGDAWKLAGDNITTTATGNLKALLDLRNVTGDLKEASEFLPIMQRMQTILAASKEENVRSHAGDLAFSAMKALDIRGAVNDPEALKRQADLMTRVIVGTQGRVTPEQFQSVFNYARQAKFSMSDDFAYKYLPTLMLENANKGGGGGSRGVGPMLAALYRFTNQGFVNRKSLPLLQELGWLGDGKVLPTGTPGTVVAPLKGAGLAASNSFEWAQERFKGIDAYLRAHHMAASDANVLQVINQATRGNQLAGSILGEFYIKRKNFERDRHLMEGVMSPAEAYKNAMSKDPDTARRALHAAWTNFETSLMVNVVPVLVPALFKLSRGLNDLGDFARRHPNLTKDAVLGFGAVAGVLAVGGPLLTGLALAKVAFGDVGGVLGKGAGGGLVGNVTKLGGGLKALGLAAAPLLAMLAVKNWAEDTSHDKERIGTLMGWSDRIKSWLPDWAGDPSKRARDSYMAARGELDGTGSDYVRTKAQQSPQMINNTIVMPNGEVLTKVMTEVMNKELRRPMAGTSRPDGRMSITPVGASGR